MRAWIIDTSTERGLIAFVENHRVYFAKELPFGYNQSKSLMPELQKACEMLQLTASQIDCIGVGVGPGSYTGIRIGVAVAKALSYAWYVPLIGFCSLEGFIPKEDACFAAIIDAKIGGAYLLKGELVQGKVHYLSQPEVTPLDQLGEKLQNTPILVTPNCQILKGKVESLYPQAAWQWEETAPSAEHIRSIVRAKYEKGEGSFDGSVELLYLRH